MFEQAQKTYNSHAYNPWSRCTEKFVAPTLHKIYWLDEDKLRLLLVCISIFIVCIETNCLVHNNPFS